MAAITHDRKARITARVTSDVQTVLEDAAAFLGVPLTSFIVSAAMEKAGLILAAERAIKLSREDAEAFSRAVESPSGPNEALLKEARNFSSVVRE